MCGLAGLSLATARHDADELVRQMIRRMRHRGPDGDGYQSDAPGAYWGFCRLAIRDLHPRAAQPMQSRSGRTWVVFNGEIYNSTELASRLCPDMAWRTTSDTEVLLELFERHGEDVFEQLNGMFAAAFYDLPSKRWTLVRDRMGKKPLFLYQRPGLVAFASELEALGPLGLEPDPQTTPLYLQYGYFPGETTFYRNVKQLRPGEIAIVQRGHLQRRSFYFRWTDVAWGWTRAVRVDRVYELVRRSVARRLVSDVPVGAFLSSGIDSTLIASVLRPPCINQPPSCDTSTRQNDAEWASGHAADAIPTFTVAFEEDRLNEAHAAARTARRLQLPHHILPCRADDVQQLAEEFLHTYQQPFADTSGLATLQLCRLVRPYVTVALSGDGGDEFFGGYRRYQWLDWAWRVRRMPATVRRLVRTALPWIQPDQAARIGRWLETDDVAGLYAEIVRAWHVTPIQDVVCRDLVMDDPAGWVRDLFARVPADPLSQASCFDATYYLPDDLQVKVDRASMRVALEVRCPLLDPDVSLYGASIDRAEKYGGGSKAVLRRLLADRLVHHAAGRPKRGFTVPLAKWLDGPLHCAVHDTFSSRGWRECGWLDAPQVDRVWQRFLRGERHLASNVWMVWSLARSLLARQAHKADRRVA